MLTRPSDLSDDELVSLLARAWRLDVSSLAYRPVGFGSHHWEAVDTAGTRWFVTVDEGGPFDRLRASLATARDVADGGHTFVVAPVPTAAGEPLAPMGTRFAVALYPFVTGQSFGWGGFSSPAHRWATLDLIVALHGVRSRHALVDDFGVPHRDTLEAALSTEGADCGPYAVATSRLLTPSAPVRRLLASYDELVREAQPDRAVLTHGEPHSGNTMRTTDGWRLVDWDTALLAPPERDLWFLNSGDGSVTRAYAVATGVTPLASMLELYRLRWDLADLASYVARFRRPHTGTADDTESWQNLSTLVAALR